MDTFERLLKVCDAVFEGQIDISVIKPETLLREDLSINSIGLLYMAMAVEEEFGIKFNNDDFIDIKTVADVIRIIEGKVS
ncbi:MAG: acyl carrier protein [Clostridia bacterium]|nr:acyl carrier protein [Clostridia bacterium]MBQ5717155.1 acyl carrier protein [Clostridia bacterium]MBQ9847013.1 acyl carrier protein [Clostridia bacterium]